MNVCMRCFVSGKVQGVWFRASTKTEAQRHNLKGWVRNLADGRVEVLACGDEKQLELLEQWLHKGPDLAQVMQCSREILPWQEFPSFEVI
jgi:acylphosphatase